MEILSGIVMFLIMAIVTTDVAMRYLLNQPFSWAYQFISLYLMMAMFYFALSPAFTGHAHVGIDLAHYFMPGWARRACDVLVCWLSLILFVYITWAVAERTIVAFNDADTIAGEIAWPSWASMIFVPLGAGVLAVRLALNAVAHSFALLGGKEIIPLAPLSGLADTGTRSFE